ncbi:unnamed protein product, partial [Mesorhabditis belari]|uniref:Ubiquitin-like domain-containing protein n=1 Tax=Mesorhabditis belari TaxID=2138241 RepID=A0AAF3J1Z3_9BILA
MFADFHPEGIGIEVIFLLVGIFFGTILYLAWLSTGFPALNYEIFLVEMQTWASHRFVQVLHVGLNDVRQFPGDLVRRIRAAGARFRPSTNESAPRAISHINIVIQSPETIVEGQAIESIPNGEMRLYQVQIPIQMNAGRESEFSDSELAALATLAVVTGRNASENTRTVNFEGEEVFEETRTERTVENATLVGEGPLPSEMGESSNEESSETSESDDVQENDVELIEEKEEIEKPNTALKLKFLDDTHVMASTVFNRTVGDFKKEFFATALAEGKVVRLIYKGQLLRDDNRSLSSYGVEDQCVVHCHVSNTPYRKAPQPTEPHRSSGDIQSENSMPSVPVSTAPPPRASNPIQHAFNSLVTQFPLTTFRGETMTAAFHGFMSDPSTPTSHPQNRGFFSNIYRRFQNALSAFESSGNGDGVEFAAQRAANPVFRLEIGDFVLWIFAIQLAVVWGFWWMYPHLCDNTAFYLLLLFTVYFLFIVCRHHIFPEPIETV